ncbi:tetratricopeptide repeat protein [Agromyces sp. NPDC049794]|uniref:tetratricopeptide repeat protein n=1 Tax=unclassified Agromyces TaxID=2639701 RepID=UPI003400457C
MDTVAVLSAARDAYRHHDWVAARDGYARLQDAARLETPDLYALGDCHWWLGEFDRALVVLHEAYRLAVAAQAAEQAARIALDVAYTLSLLDEHAQASGWMRRATRAAAELPDHPVHGYFDYVGFEEAFDRNDLDGAERAAVLVDRRARRHDDPTLAALAVLAFGRIAVRRGETDRGLAMLDEAMLAAVSDEIAPDWAGNIYCHLITACEEIADLRRAMEWTNATARWCESMPGGAGPFLGICRVHRATLLQLRGDWPQARREARRVISQADRIPASNAAEAHYVLGEIAREQGDFVTAERQFRRAHELGRDPHPGLARLALDRGDYAAADTAIRSALAGVPDDPLARARLLPTAVETAIAIGDLEQAGLMCTELSELAAVFRTAGFEAASAHASGRLLLTTEGPAAALPTLRRALQLWQDVGAVLPSIRIRSDLGRAYSAMGDTEAAERERRAADAARTSLLAEPQRLRLSGHDPGLTPRETQVLTLVATGRTNQEIADDLFLSVRTVERHLVGVYGKLGVGGRTARAAAVGLALRNGLIDPLA